MQLWPIGSPYEYDRYEGEFQDGYRNGFGIYYWPNGVRYQGNWQNGKRHGDGVEFAPDGSIFEAGFWSDGKVIDKDVIVNGTNRVTSKANVEIINQNELRKSEERLKLSNSNLHLSPLHRMQWEESQQKYVIHYPEGMVELNQTSAEILKLCDGSHNLEQIVSELERKFVTIGLFKDINGFLEIALKNGWVQYV